MNSFAPLRYFVYTRDGRALQRWTYIRFRQPIYID
jgi:hypothetical protein